jgi:hypothetical protein
MRAVCIIVLLGLSINCFAQNSKLFDKVIITYNRGGNTFGTPGISSAGEIFELVPRNETSYKFAYYKRTQDSISPDRKRYLKDTFSMPLKKIDISKAKIDTLFAALSITKSNFTPEFIKPFLRKPTKAQILADTNYVNKKYKFEDIDKDELKDNIERIKKFDKIDLFINKSRPLSNPIYTVTSDAWDGLRVTFIKNRDTIKFDFDFYRPLGQPVTRITYNKQMNLDQFTNVEANQLLEEILPKGAKSKYRVAINSCTDDYIKWYIDNVL